LKSRGAEKKQERDNLRAELAALQTKDGKLLARLKGFNVDVATGWQWIQDNQDKFEKEVFGPPMLSCSIKDARYSDHVQALLRPDDMLCFITQTREDHKKLSDCLYKDMRITATIRTCLTSFQSFQHPVPAENLKTMGLDGYVSDLLQGPDPVLAMLCAERSIHTSAVGLNDISDGQYQRILAGGKINNFAAGRSLYRVTRRKEYGPKAESTRTSQFERGKYWTDEPVEKPHLDELQRKSEQVGKEIDELKERFKEINEKRSEKEKEFKEAKAREVSAKPALWLDMNIY
jgi:hypothetical protein